MADSHEGSGKRQEGYEVYPVVDAVGGTSVDAHTYALQRLSQAGARPISLTQLLCELQRDWARSETAEKFMQITPAIQFAQDLNGG
jgi:nicotinamidase-related amidase